MPYLINRNGAFWFQIRVPKVLVPRYGMHIRQNLSLTERSIAQAMAYQLASYWMTRFACDRETLKDQGPSSPLLQYPRMGTDEFTPESPATPPPYAETSASQNKTCWSIGANFTRIAVKALTKKPPRSSGTSNVLSANVFPNLRRTDVAAFRDKQIAKRLACSCRQRTMPAHLLSYCFFRNDCRIIRTDVS